MKKEIVAILAGLIMLGTCYAEETKEVVLLPKDASIEGTIINYDNDHLGNWRQSEDLIKFNIPNLKKGKYRVILKYSAPDDLGGRILVKINDLEIKETLGGTGGWGAPYPKKLENIKHPGGAVDITLQILKARTEWQPVIDVYSITFEER